MTAAYYIARFYKIVMKINKMTRKRVNNVVYFSFSCSDIDIINISIDVSFHNFKES